MLRYLYKALTSSQSILFIVIFYYLLKIAHGNPCSLLEPSTNAALVWQQRPCSLMGHFQSRIDVTLPKKPHPFR